MEAEVEAMDAERSLLVVPHWRSRHSRQSADLVFGSCAYRRHPRDSAAPVTFPVFGDCPLPLDVCGEII